MVQSLLTGIPSNSPATFIRAGGSLGIAGCCIGLAVFLMGCAGFDAAFWFSPIPVAMGMIGFAMIAIEALRQRGQAIADMQILAAFFVTIISFLGGLLEMAAWRHWPIMFNQPV